LHIKFIVVIFVPYNKTNIIMKIEAKNLKVGSKYVSNNNIIQEVTEIVKISEKTIEYRTKRIYPDIYEGNFFQRKKLTTKIELA